MPINPLDPGFVKLFYSRPGSDHVATYQIEFVGTPTAGIEPSFEARSGLPILQGVAMAEWINAVKLGFFTGVTFVRAESWYKPTPASDPVFIFTTAHGIVGLSAVSPVVAGQYVQSFRTIIGGVLKIYFMETSAPPDVVSNPPYGPGTLQDAISDYLFGATAVIRGRDDAFITADIRSVTKINDALRKKLILNA